jgi:hypothetical protein
LKFEQYFTTFYHPEKSKEKEGKKWKENEKKRRKNEESFVVLVSI